MDALTLMQNMLAMSQTHRLLRMFFPHDNPPDALLVVDSLDAQEELSRDFIYSVTLLSDDPQIELKDMIHKMVAIELEREDGSTRCFNGYVTEFHYIGTDGGLAKYRMVLSPWLGQLKLRHNFRIFHNEDLEEQIAKIFDHYGVFKSWRLGMFLNPDPKMTDAVQFDESDYNYVHRRAENLGWLYWYEHTRKNHTIVFADDSVSAKPIDGDPNVIYRTLTGSTTANVIHSLIPRREVITTRYAASSFDFKSPHPVFSELDTDMKQGDAAPLDAMEVYEYTGNYGFTRGFPAEKQTEIRMQEMEARAKTFVGSGTCRYLQPGRWFTLDNTDYHSESFPKDDDLTFLVTRVSHKIQNNYLQESTGASYSNTFECIRKKIPWRPGRGYNSHTVSVQAPQTALVVGNHGDPEIHTDQYGRVRVQFHWDREGKYDAASSGFIRVASAHAGNHFGQMMLPRIGEEVIVEFLDGNPDRPIITGRVYNRENMTPWELPSQRVLMGIRSKEIGGKGFNNMTLDDTTGEIQAQLSTTHELTQLNMGHITRLVETQGRKEHRGDGFELRTDGWGGIRAGKGMYVSTDLRDEAKGKQLDLQEAITQLENALALAKSVKAAAGTAAAKQADTGDQEAQLNGVYKDLKRPGILMSSPKGTAVVSPKSVQFSSGTNVTLTSWKNTDISAYKDVRVGAKGAVSVFAAEKDMRLITGKGKMQLHANTNAMKLVAKQKIKLHSISANTEISAKSKMVLAAGGGFIEMSGGKVTMGGPSGFHVKSGTFNVTGAGSKNPPMSLPGAQNVSLQNLKPAKEEPPKYKPEARKVLAKPLPDAVDKPPEMNFNPDVKASSAEAVNVASESSTLTGGEAVVAVGTQQASYETTGWQRSAAGAAAVGAVAGAAGVASAAANDSVPPPANLSDLPIPDSVEAAPEVVNLSQLNGAFQENWKNSKGPNKPTREHGGALAADSEGNFVLANQGCGSQKDFLPNVKIDPALSYVGTFHTHPYSEVEGGFTGVPFTAADYDWMINGPFDSKGKSVANLTEKIAVVQSGEKQFLIMRTAQTPDEIDEDAIADAYYEAYDKCDKGFVEDNTAGSKATAKVLNLAFYEGKDGIFKKVV